MAKNATAGKAVSEVHFILQGKGGVGKSFVAALLAQYFGSIGAPVKCVDTDPVNQTLANYKALQTSHIPIMEGSKIDERKFDQLMERLLSEDGIFVVDNGSSSFIPLSNYLLENNAIAMLKEAGRAVYIHCVITGGQALLDTLSGLNALAGQTETGNIVVWLNEYFGPIERDGKVFTDMKVYAEHKEKIRGIVRIAKRNQDTFGRDIEDLVSKKMTFAEAIESSGFPIMAKQRIKTVLKDIFNQLDEIGF